MDPITIFTAFAPVLIEAGKAAISRWIAPQELKPATVEQYVQMRELDLRFFQAITQAGGSNPSYPWVEAIVKLMRPFVAAVVILVWAHAHGFLWSPAMEDTLAVDNFASAIGFYLFGDRSLFYAKRLTRSGN